ncbi:MAG: hypothetical protein ACD_28C00076G0001, partial [uncultured bacterium]
GAEPPQAYSKSHRGFSVESMERLKRQNPATYRYTRMPITTIESNSTHNVLLIMIIRSL